MVRIVSDTSTLYSTAQAREAGFAVSPLSVTINGKSYREFDEISSQEFVDIIHQGHMPTSSQPAIGEVTALYEEFAGDEILNIAMADGLSGTYKSACAAAEICDNVNQITVVNTTTLCGPHRYMVQQCLAMAQEGKSMAEITAWLQNKVTQHKSFLIPADFDYLRRGGRLSPLVSHVGKAVGLTPVMTQTDDGCRLTVAGIRRGFSHGIKYVVEYMKKQNVGKDHKIYISHAATADMVELTEKMLRTAFPESDLEIVPLSPAFITQGGPNCLAVQYILK